MSRCRRCQRCRLSVEGVSRECRLTLVSRCRGCRGSVDGDLDIRDALMLSRGQRCQGGGWAHGQSKLIGVQSVPTAQGMSPYHNTSPQYTLEPQRRGLSTFPAWLTLLTPVDNIRASRMSTLVDTSVGGVEVVARWCRLTPVSTVSTVSRECRDSVESVEPGLKCVWGATRGRVGSRRGKRGAAAAVGHVEAAHVCHVLLSARGEAFTVK